MDSDLSRSELRRLIKAKAWTSLEELLRRVNPADLSAHAAGLRAEDLYQLVRHLPAHRAADLFGRLPHGFQNALADRLGQNQLRELLNRLPPDDRARFVAGLTPPQAEALLAIMDQDLRGETEDLLGWPSGAVGRCMDTRVMTFSAEVTIGEVLESLRAASRRHRVHSDAVFVVDERQRLLGYLELPRLLLADIDDFVGDIAEPVTHVVAAALPIREVPPVARHYDLDFLPVVNDEHRLVGVITTDQIVEAALDEDTSIFQRSAGVGPIGDRVSHARPSLLYRKRIGWLLILLLGGLGTSSLLAEAGMTVAQWLPLILFLPLVIDSAGNAGAQSALLTIRGLATGEIRVRDWQNLWRREVLVALALGLTLAVPAALIGLWRSDATVALIVLISLPICVLFGALIGVLLPLALARLRLDPAYGSAPLVTTLADVAGLLMYLLLATWLL